MRLILETRKTTVPVDKEVKGVFEVTASFSETNEVEPVTILSYVDEKCTNELRSIHFVMANFQEILEMGLGKG